MSRRRVRARLAARCRGETGFTLIELMVAITLLALVMTAILPVIVAGVRAGVSTKYQTQARNLGQERLERMRNLPYHVDAGVPINVAPFTNVIDVLDIYYVNSTSTASGTTVASGAGVVQSGWVCASCARLATPTTVAAPPGAGSISPALEPASGSFYRTVHEFTGPGQDPALAKFRQVVDTQFLTAAGAPVNPAANAYDNLTPAPPGRTDNPVSTLIGVTVLTTWTEFGRYKANVLSSRLTDRAPATPTITSQARASMVKITSTRDASTSMALEAGAVSADGSLATGATASVQAQGVTAALSPGVRVDGTTQSVAAPPDSAVPVAGPPMVASGSVDATCTISSPACFFQSSVAQLSALVTGGLPKVATSASPATAVLTRASSGSSGTRGFIFNNAPSPPAKLGLTAPLVTVGESGSSGSDLVIASAYLGATQGTSHTVTAGTSGSTATLGLLRTSWTPANRGLVEIAVPTAALTCSASAGTPTATADYSATVRYYSDVSKSYVTLATITEDQGSDPLGIPLATTLVRNDPTYGPLYLGDYIASWSSAGAARTTTDPDGHGIRAELPSIVTLATQPTRAGDTTSAVSLQVGRLSCYALDARP